MSNTARVNGDHHCLASETSRKLADQFRRLDGRRVDRDFVRSCREQPPRVVERPHAPADREGNEQLSRHLAHRVHQRGPTLARGGDIEHDEFVRPLAVIGLGQVARIAGIAQVHKADAFDHATVFAVEARDDAFGEHLELSVVSSQ